MSDVIEKCPACGKQIKDGIFSSNPLLNTLKNELINEYNSKISQYRCTKCGDPLLSKALSELKRENKNIGQKMMRLIPYVPLASIHSPQGWEYTVRNLVTAQSTTGTGVFSDFTSSFTDFFGIQSGVYNKKIHAGENMCRNILRKMALDSGGNAVIGVDIDYAEVGGERGMLMVCMTGTAISLRNVELVGNKAAEILAKIQELQKRITYLSRYTSITA